MADIAKIGFEADTSDLEKAEADLKALIPAAKGVEKGAKDAGAAMKAAAAGAKDGGAAMKAAASGAKDAGAAMSSAAAGTQKYAANLGNFNSHMALFNANNKKMVEGLRAAALGLQQQDAHMVAYRQHLVNARNDLDHMGGGFKLTAREGLNFSRQIADIGVTAAMGMNPLMIAIQQGPQLFDILQEKALTSGQSIKQVMAGVGTAIWTALAPILPIVLAIAAAVGLVVAAFAIGAKAINDANGSIVKGLGLTKEQLKRVEESGVSTAVTFGDVFVATFQVIGERLKSAFEGPLKWLADAFQAVFEFIKDGAVLTTKVLIAAFVAPITGIIAAWKLIPGAIGDAAISATNFVLRATENMLNMVIRGVNRLTGFVERIAAVVGLDFNIGELAEVDFGQLENKWQGQGRAAGEAFMKGYRDGAQASASAVDDFFADIGARAVKNRTAKILEAAGDAPKSKTAKETGKTDAEKYEDIVNGAKRAITAMQAERDAVDMTAAAAARLKYETQLLNEASEKGLKLTADQVKELKGLADQMAELEIATARDRGMKEITSGIDERMVALRQEQSMIGLSADQALRLKNEYDLLAQARQKDIDLTPAEVEALKTAAGHMSDVEIAIRKATDALEFKRGVVRGFVEDLRSGLQQGKSLWEAFGNAVINVLSKIADRMMDAALDGLFTPGKGGGGGNWFTRALSAGLGSLIPGGNAVSGGITGAGVGGGIPGGGAIQWAAKGTVINSPTMFDHSRGRTVAGEAGPEAILPLDRGPDGKLGVNMTGGGGKGPVYVTMGDVYNTHYLTGAISSNDIVEMNRQSADQTKREIKRDLMATISQIQQDGAIVD